MFFELIATISMGAAAAGLILVINKILGGRLPRWAMPAAAGAAMLIFTIFSEYNWYPRLEKSLPEDVVVVQTRERSVFYRPWTYARPMTTGFIVVDRRGEVANKINPALVMVGILIFNRWEDTVKIDAVFDCDKQLRADFFNGFGADEQATLEAATWKPLAADDKAMTVACVKRG